MVNLLTLPRELRDCIYEYLLIKDDNTITMLDNFRCYKNEVSACPPPICSVNKQLRAETLPAYYSSNVFTAQLDNAYDLDTAKVWLSTIGDKNAAHIRWLGLRGWTKVPFGHMISRRWVQVKFDLREGEMVVENQDGKYATAGEHPRVTSTMADLRAAYATLVTARQGRPFDVESVGNLMEGFNLLCTGY